jgi:hypothetical protein
MDRKEHTMSKDTKLVHGYEEIELSELDTMAVELPDRVALSLANANVALPINAAVALNALSDNSVAIAQATQTAPILQSTAPFMGSGQ